MTSALGPTFFVDDAATGGGDVTITQSAVQTYNRSFAGLLNVNQGRSRVTLTGFGFASSTAAAENTATSLTLAFTYLGADEAVGGGDDVVVGSAVGTYVHSIVAGSEYIFAFDTPITADLDITGTRFLIQVTPANGTNDGKVRFKTTNASTGPLTYESTNGPKFSVAGIVAPQRVNLAKFQPATSSSAATYRLASYLTDGHAGNDNRWQSSGNGQHWARVDFPFPMEIGSAQVFTGVDDTNAQTGFRIQYLNGTSWVDAPGAVITGNNNIERNIVFTTPVTASAFRVFSNDNTLRVRELALYPPNGSSGFPLGTDVTMNLAEQRPATATDRSPGNFALLAVDGRANEASKWQTSTAGIQSLEIDLRVSTKIGSAHLYSGSSGVVPLAAFELKYWNGSTWQAIPGAAVTGNASPALVIPFTTPVTTSRLLLEFTNPGTTSVRELCIFPANRSNLGYPLGTGVTGLPPLTAKFDDYRDAFHLITNAAAGQAIAVSNGAPTLNQSSLTLTDRQYQILLNLDSGTYRLRNRATGLCLSGARLSKAPGAPLLDAPYAALPDQDWILSRTGATHFCLINPWSGLVIDTQGAATAPGTPLVQNVRNGSATQSWQIDISTHSPKKGVGGTTVATATNTNWAYNWGLANSTPLPAGAVFHSMQWGNFNWNFDTTAASTWSSYSDWRTAGHPLHLLGFNEPDKVDQSGNSLDLENTNTEDFSPTRSMNTAVTLWPRLLAMDMPLVSPVPAGMSNGWLADFYSNANTLGYRVDYTALHSYPSPSGGSATNLINSLLSGYNTWGRPVWLTEFSFVNWSGTGTWTEEDNYNCLAEFMWRAESLPWLHKYALFVFREAGPDNPNNPPSPAPENPWSPVGPRSNAIDLDGKLTAFGKLYSAWDGDATIRTDKRYFIHHKSTRKRLASNPGQSTAAAHNIRIDTPVIHWTLVPAGTSNRYHLVSQNDGRRLSTNGTTVVLDPAGFTGSAVEWSLTEAQHGWHYLDHPATSKRLKMTYDNSTSTPTFTLVATSDVTDSVQWRFIVPMPPPAWSGTTSTNWNVAENWATGTVPSTGEQVIFDNSSTTNLGTILNQDFDLAGVSVKNPAGAVSIGGTHTLTLGHSGFDLSAATRDLTVTTPVLLGATQNWNIGTGRTLHVNGAVSGASAVNITGAGRVSAGAPIAPTVPITIASGGTLKTGVSGVLASGATAVSPTINGTLDLYETTQSINGLSGTGIIDNTRGAAVLTVGSNDVTSTFGGTLQNTSGTLGLIKTGAGNLTLTGNNTYSGGTTHHGAGGIYPKTDTAFGGGPVVMNAGTLYATGGAYTFANALILNGGILRVGGGAGRSINWSGPVAVTADSVLSADGSTSGITLSNTVTLSGFTLTSFAGGGSLGNTISGPVTGHGTVIANGGPLDLNASNSFNGTFRSALGILKIGDPLAMQNATLDMNAADTGTVNLNNLSATLGALTGSRNLALGSGTVSIGNNGLSTTYSGVLSGSGSLLKTGTGTLTLSATNNHTGPTRIDAGTLALGAGNVLPGTPVSIGNATLDAATFSDTVGTLDVTGTARIHLGTGAALAFANSSAIDWTGGTLDLTGTFVPGVSLRFGTTSGGLTPTQLGLITVNGGSGPFVLNASGFLAVASTDPYDLWKSQITSGLDGRTEDADGDGFTNLQEFLFGSSPITGTGSLMTATASGDNLVLRWLQLESGASYTLTQSPTLADGSWVPATPAPILDPDQTGAPVNYDYHTTTVPPGSGNLFFRVKSEEN